MELPENKLADFIQGNDRAKWRPVNNHNINKFTEDEIKRITKNYSTLIGKGGFGEVYHGVLDDGSPIAVKKYICQNLKDGFAKEMTVHCQINHKNVVRLLGYCSEENASMMVTEYISGGNLNNLLHGRNDPISLDARLGIAIDCAEALACMHSMYQPIIHGDIKPDNILVDCNLGAKLSDFGISRLFVKDKTQNVAGCIGYMDPKLLLDGHVDPKNDVYSFGVVLLELVTRKKASENGISTGLTRNFTQALEKGKKTREMFDTEIANVRNMKVLDKTGKLAGECLRKDFKERPEMKDVAERLRMLRKIHCQQGQEKIGPWLLWGAQPTYKLSSLDIFNRNARTNFMRNGGPILRNVRGLCIFTKEELRRITKDYSEVLGKGSFGRVYKGTLPDNTMVAVKASIKVSVARKWEFTKGVEIQTRMIHKNILKLLGCCLEVDVPMLVYEFAANGSLQDTLHGNNSHRIPLPLGLRLDIAIEAAEGLTYMHSSTAGTIRHGDVNAANILLDDKYMPKISGFWASVFLTMDSDTTLVIGTMGYIDPVFLKTGLLTPKSDVYSFGVVLLELITRRPVSYENRSLVVEFLKVYEQENSGRGMFDKDIATEEDILILEEIGRLAVACLKADKEERPEMKEVAERLVMLRRARKSGKTNYISSDRSEEISTDGAPN